MPGIRINHVLIAVLAALVASFALTSLAAAGDYKKQITDTDFVVTSDGAYVDYDLAAKPASQRVLIDGKVAKLKLIDKAEHEYVAIVHKPDLEAGRSYRVRITVRTKGSGTLLLDERMFLHKRHKVEPQG